jgi:LacI family transcriptional regulator
LRQQNLTINEDGNISMEQEAIPGEMLSMAQATRLCGNASLTVGALLESQEMGIKVPAEMSIVGYDDIEIMSELPIPITTVRVSSDEMGRRAARLLVSKIDGRPSDLNLECDAGVIVRRSSGPAPKR